MKIIDIKTFFYFSYWRNLIFVRVDTDEGITGVGEATIRNKELAVRDAVENHIAPHLIGTSPFEVEAMFNKFFTRDAWRNGAVFNSAISGIEMALWDIIGKKLSVPIYNLLGGKVRDKVRLYANGWFRGCRTCEEFAKRAVETVALGFSALKWDPLKVAPTGCSEREAVKQAIGCVEAVRQSVGIEIDLCIELHGNLSYDGAVSFARQVVPYEPLFIEEPMHPDDKSGYRKLAAKSDVAVAAGERAFTRFAYKDIFEAGNLTVIQPDISHMGGIYETKKTSAMAEAYYMKVAPHNSNGPVATMANVMLDATLPNFLIQEFMFENIQLNSELLSGPFRIQDGCILLEEKPGLGITVNFDAIAKGEYRAHFTI